MVRGAKYALYNLYDSFSDITYQPTNHALWITQASPQYSGKSFLESEIGLEHRLYETMASKVGAGMFLSVGDGKLIVIERQGNGSYRNYFGLQVPKDFFRNGTVDLHDVEATRRLLLSDFHADWSEETKNLIQHATDFRPWPLYTLSTEDLGWKSVPGFTLAGDAAHLSIPNGQGVNLAMTDSLKLASKISQHGTENFDQAVRDYEADMSLRGIATITEGRKMGDVMFQENAQAALQLMSSEGASE